MILSAFFHQYPFGTSLVVFMLGASLGSFACLCVSRLSKPGSCLRDIASPPSHCDSCGHKLSMLDNVPIFSYIALRGRCRACKTAYGPRHLFTEILFGLLVLLISLVCPPLWLFILCALALTAFFVAAGRHVPWLSGQRRAN